MKTCRVAIAYAGLEPAGLAAAIQAQGWEIEEARPGAVTVRQLLAEGEFEPAFSRLKRLFPRWTHAAFDA